MTHFTVLVVGDYPEKQLEPFCENVEAGYEHVEFKDMTQQLNNEFESKTLAVALLKDGRTVHKYEARKDDIKDQVVKEFKISPKDFYGTVEEYALKWLGKTIDDETGCYGYWHNPQAKWDWYVLGGRWTGFFKLKDGAKGVVGEVGVFGTEAKDGYVDQALKGNIDFVGMLVEQAKKAGKKWAEYQKIIQDGDGDTIKNFKFFNQITDNDTKSKFIKRNSNFVTFAILKDGQWFSQGELLMWAIVKSEKSEVQWHEEFKKIFDEIGDEELLSLYDCHI